jgi:ABC-type polysaccharide/polyol phosphate export permease
LLLIAFVIGAVIIALYPFANRNLTLRFITDDHEYVVHRNNVDIASGNCREVKFDDNADEAIVRKVRIYGGFQSVLLKELTYNELFGYIESVDQGEFQWKSDGVILTGVENIRFYMNDAYVEMLQKVSKSFLQERFIYIGMYFCLIMFLLLVSDIVRESRLEENWNNHGALFEIKKFAGDIRKYRQYVVYAANTDLKAEVANSYLNRLWWLLEPFFNMLVYVIVFGNVMGNSVENYSTFIFSALLMWNFFSKTVNYSVKLVRNNKDIITKVYIPKFIILLSNMILNFFKLLFSMMVLVVMMIIFRVHIGFNLFWFIPAYVVIILLAFGVGMIFLHFGVYVDDLSYAVGILLNMLMFLSGIFYDTMTTLPEPLNGLMMCLNPVAVAIDTMRNALLYNTASNLPILGVWFLVSVILCCIGVHIVYKNENSYVKIV